MAIYNLTPSDQKKIETIGGTTYIGVGASGSATTSPVWQIKKIVDNGLGLITIQWAGGNQSFVNIWDNRASLVYS